MTGGNDGLNMVVPYNDDDYARPGRRWPSPPRRSRRSTTRSACTPAWTGLAELLQDNALCVAQGVGYPNPTRVALPLDGHLADGRPRRRADGRLARQGAQGPAGAPSFHLKTGNEKAPLALAGAPVSVPSIATLEEFQLQTAAANGADKKNQRDVIEGAVKPKDGGGLLEFVQKTAADTYASSRRLQEIGKNYQPKATYPNTPLASRLKLAAQLIDADLGARIFYVSIDGFDTHAAQAATHANLMTQVSGAMTAFFKDLAARGHRDRILMMTFSEFGRRVKENGSKGTDHGTAAPMLLVGGKVKAGPVGKYPSLTDLEMGNLKFTTDFRQVYATILDQWLGVASKDVLGRRLSRWRSSRARRQKPLERLRGRRQRFAATEEDARMDGPDKRSPRPRGPTRWPRVTPATGHQGHDRHAQPRLDHVHNNLRIRRLHLHPRRQARAVKRIDHMLPARRAAGNKIKGRSVKSLNSSLPSCVTANGAPAARRPGSNPSRTKCRYSSVPARRLVRSGHAQGNIGIAQQSLFISRSVRLLRRTRICG